MCGALMEEAGTGPSSIAKVGEQPALTPSRPEGVLILGPTSLTYSRAGLRPYLYTIPLHVQDKKDFNPPDGQAATKLFQLLGVICPKPSFNKCL